MIAPTLTQKGQVTIPKVIRDALGWKNMIRSFLAVGNTR